MTLLQPFWEETSVMVDNRQMASGCSLRSTWTHRVTTERTDPVLAGVII